MGFSDSDLIARVLVHDDRNAFGELVRRYQSEVRNFLRRLTRQDCARADDLAQETFVKGYQSLRKYRGSGKFSSWLYTIAYRTFLNDCRKRRETVTYGDELEHVEDGRSRPPKGLVLDVDEALNQLSEAERAVFDLRYRKGLTYTEITEVLSMPMGTVKSHLARGKETLKTLLKDWKSDGQ